MEQTQEQQLIKKDMLIADAVEKYPQVATVLTGYGLHCIGCGAATFETIESGAKGHGMDDEMVDMMIRDANAVAKVENVEGEEMKVTEKAAEQVAAFKKKSGKEDHFLRISVKDGGCSGKSYDFKLDSEKSDNDKVINAHGEDFVLDPDSFEQLKGSKIDYLETLQSSGFKIHNPNAKQTCGCGSSFA